MGVERLDNVGSGSCEGLPGDVREAGGAELGGWPWINDVGMVIVGFLDDGWCDMRSFNC